jgi:hypothetical protein
MRRQMAINDWPTVAISKIISSSAFWLICRSYIHHWQASVEMQKNRDLLLQSRENPYGDICSQNVQSEPADCVTRRRSFCPCVSHKLWNLVGRPSCLKRVSGRWHLVRVMAYSSRLTRFVALISLRMPMFLRTSECHDYITHGKRNTFARRPRMFTEPRPSISVNLHRPGIQTIPIKNVRTLLSLRTSVLPLKESNESFRVFHIDPNFPSMADCSIHESYRSDRCILRFVMRTNGKVGEQKPLDRGKRVKHLKGE